MSPELREPPRPGSAPNRFAGAVPGLLAANLVLVAAVGGLVLWRTGSGRGGGAGGDEARATRQVAAKLQTAGALDEAAALYESVFARSSDTAAGSGEPAEARAKIAYSLGSNYLDAGRYEKALRWFYEAETLGPGPLADDVNRKIVTTLDRLGRPRAAQAALASRVQLGGEGGDGGEGAAEGAGGEVKRSADDPVVAKIGEREIRRSEVDRVLDDLPPEMARALAGASPADLLRRYVADELMWGKAVKLGYDRDPQVLHQQQTLAKQLAVARFLDQEVVGKIAVDDVDLQSWFAANKDRYKAAAGKDAKEVTLDQVRPVVEREVRMAKAQETYQKMIDAELSAGDVELFPERMGAGGTAAPKAGRRAPAAGGAPTPSAPGNPGNPGNPGQGSGQGGGSR